jgi:hypothetical protein
MRGAGSSPVDIGERQALPNTSDVVIAGAATSGNATARTLIGVACLTMVAACVLATGHIYFSSDFSAREPQALQDLPIGLSATSSTYHALMAGARPTGDQAAHEMSTELGGAAAGCGSCDARHRDLGRLGESLAP